MFETIRKKMKNGSETSDYPNVYYPIDEKEIAESESRLGFPLPSQLRIFHREIGYGFFTSSSPQSPQDGIFYINRFLAPSQIADLLLDPDDVCRPSEGFDDGEIPFFEIADQLYLVLRQSSHNYQVAWSSGNVICDDLVEFTRRLASNPRFYQS